MSMPVEPIPTYDLSVTPPSAVTKNTAFVPYKLTYWRGDGYSATLAQPAEGGDDLYVVVSKAGKSWAGTVVGIDAAIALVAKIATEQQAKEKPVDVDVSKEETAMPPTQPAKD